MKSWDMRHTPDLLFSIDGNVCSEVRFSFGAQASGTPVARYYEVDFPEVTPTSYPDVSSDS